jgi:hypothetical protein
MLDHYARLGFDSLTVNVHLDRCSDPLLQEVTTIARSFGAEIGSVFAGKWLQSVNPFLYGHSQRQKPSDWFVLADIDELQVYPTNLRTFFEQMDSLGFDYIEGCIVDRIARDGTLPAVVDDVAIWDQFPLAGLITYPVLRANILKIVAAKGFVNLTPGQHSACNGIGCPRDCQYIPVHHFKWSASVVERLRKRVELYKTFDEPIWPESQRFIDYMEQHCGKIDVSDPTFCLAESAMQYPLWEAVKNRVFFTAKAFGL